MSNLVRLVHCEVLHFVCGCWCHFGLKDPAPVTQINFWSSECLALFSRAWGHGAMASSSSSQVPGKPPPKAPPPALQKQLAMAHLRASEHVMPDDSASMVGSATGSSASWTRVNASGPVIIEVTESTMPVIEENKSEAGKVITGPAQEDPWATDDAPVFWCGHSSTTCSKSSSSSSTSSSQCSSSCHSGSSKLARRGQ